MAHINHVNGNSTGKSSTSREICSEESNTDGIRNHQRQVVYEQEEPCKILLGHRGYVYYVPAVSVYAQRSPELTLVKLSLQKGYDCDSVRLRKLPQRGAQRMSWCLG